MNFQVGIIVDAKIIFLHVSKTNLSRKILVTSSDAVFRKIIKRMIVTILVIFMLCKPCSRVYFIIAGIQAARSLDVPFTKVLVFYFSS